MKIVTDIDFLPNIQKFFPKIDESKLFYKDYGHKHPSAIYNNSFGKIENAVKDFLDSYDLFIQEGFEDRKKDYVPLMLKNYRYVLYTLREHLDDCLTIIKVFITPSEKVCKERNQYKWLEINAHDTVEDFFKSIADYKKYLDLSVNELKHNNAILGSIAFFNPNSSDCCVGYFIANVIDDCYEPVGKIHPKFQNVYTGFSFRRDLIYNLYCVYGIAENMTMFLEDKISIDFNNLIPNVEAAPENRIALFQRIMDLPRIHFPDEYVKPVPSISITDEKKLKLEYPSLLAIKPNRLGRTILTHSGDGHTQKFKVLYT